MEEDKDLFLEDEVLDDTCINTLKCNVDDENRERQNTLRSSPILNASGLVHKYSSAAGRKRRLRRSISGAFPASAVPHPIALTLEDLKIPPSSPSEGLLLSQELQSGFIAPKTPARKVPQRNLSQQCGSDSDEDIFASSMCGNEEPTIPCALNALFDGPEPSDLSWTSSMATPLASNVTWSNLNTEERKVLLPSEDCNLAVKPRALFSAELNDTADSNSLNVSTDGEYIQTLRGEKTDKTPKYRGRKNSLVSKTPMDSPLATILGADNSAFSTPHQKPDETCDLDSRGSPILSGSKEFTKTPKQDQVLHDEDNLFDNDEECLNRILPCNEISNAKHSKVAESTPNLVSRNKSLDNQSSTPLKSKPGRAESFLGDISVSVLEEVCQAQEMKDASAPPVATPEKQPDSKRKRLLFSTNPGFVNPAKPEFKIPETKSQVMVENSLQENLADHCIPDDSFMEHLAAMNTSIFSDALQPATKVQSIKSSVSQMKKFCYSFDKKSDPKQNCAEPPSMSKPQNVVKEILNSVIALETPSNTSSKIKSFKPSGDLIVFSQLKEEMDKKVNYDKEERVKNVTPIEYGDNPFPPKIVTEVDKGEEVPVSMDSAPLPCQGFQTANGDKIELSQEALQKGFSLLKDTLDDFEVKKLTTSTTSSKAAEARQNEVKPTHFSDDLAAEEVKQLLQLVSDGEDFHPWHEMEQSNSLKSGKPFPSPEKKPVRNVDLASTEKTSSSVKESDVLSVDSPLCGFSTASGKNITVSDEKLEQAKQLLLEPEDKSTNFSGEDSGLDKNIVSREARDRRSTDIQHDVKDKNCEAKEVLCQLDRKRAFMGSANSSSFPVPRKKACLGISASTPTPRPKHGPNLQPALLDQKAERSMGGSLNTNARHMLGTQHCDDVLKEAGCYTSVSNTSAEDEFDMKISEKAMNFMNNVLDNFKSKRKDAPSSSKHLNPLGFSTASGKTVNVSKQSLNKVKNLFDDLPTESNEGKSLLGSEKNVFVDTSTEVEDLPIKASTVTQPHTNQETGPSLFSTASGKSVTVSEHAINRVKNLFEDLPENSVSTFTETSSLQSSYEVVDGDISKCAGFSTASGRKVDVSEKAVSQVKDLFKNLSDSNLESKSKDLLKTSAVNVRRSLGSTVKLKAPSSTEAQPSVYETEAGSFTMASGKKVTVSKRALSRVKGFFDDLPSFPVQDQDDSSDSSALRKETHLNGDISSGMGGFSTASGKTVNVSEQALEKVKNMFDNLGESDKSKTCFQTDQHTASYSRNAAFSMQNINNGDEQLVQNKDFMEGFSTAGGKPVNISKEALHKAKGLFDGEDIAAESLGSSVSASSETRTVNISHEVLSKSAATSSRHIAMPGFSTAGGKTVQISKEALSKAKDLFDNLASESSSCAEESVSVTPRAGRKAGSTVADDSGVFMSHDSTHHESILKSKETPPNSLRKFTLSLHANKENQSSCSLQKSSLTQEITESTAAFLADDDFFGPADSFDETRNNKRQTISTSPSMVTDRFSNLKPVLSSASENKCPPSEPTSPILVRSDSAGGLRKRPRRGRLSLSTNAGTLTASQTVTSSQSCSQAKRRSLPCQVSSADVISVPPSAIMSNRIAEATKSSCPEDISSMHINSNLISQISPSRKLFIQETDSPPSKLNSPSAEASLNKPQKIESEAPAVRTSDPKDLHSSRPSLQNPLMRRTLTRNLGAQSSGFKTPYKSSNKEQQKRSPSSPAQNPPETKRMKPSSNLYVSHIYFTASESEKPSPRMLRPEVAEMRRRAVAEQRQLVENYTEHKGELLRPCAGNWLSGKLQAKLMRIFKMGTPASYSSSDLAKFGLKASTLSVSADNSAEFRFSAWDYYSEDVCQENVAGLRVGDGALLVLDSQGSVGVEEFERSFLASPGVDPSLVPCGWIKNHYRWLVWKLAALEWRFPHQLGGRCLTPHILMLQLKYRYDREIDRCERPALRRILEHDDSAAKRMVLCVASILNPQKEHEGGGLELELTDGWYSLTASIDQDMQHRVKKGVIQVGTKLVMHGAELLNCSEGCDPLQVRPEVRLKLCSNSSRRALWHAKLGFQRNPGPINLSLTSILSAGGLVSCVSAYVARVYPIAFMEKTEERTVVRSERAECKEKAKCEKKRQQLLEGVYSQVQAELQHEQNKQRRPGVKFSMKHLSTLTSAEELSEILENTSDPHSVQSMLSEEQKSIIFDYQRSKQDELRSEMEARVKLKLSENSHERQVTPVLKVRLFEGLNDKQSCAILSIWRPSEDMSSVFKEGHKLTIYGAVANGLRFGELQLSANRSTRYLTNNTSEINADLSRSVSPLSSLSVHGSLPRFGELDIVGVVIRISPEPQTPENTSYFQTVYLSDCQQNIVSLLFRGGMKVFGWEDLITPHSFIAASNLQWRGSPVVRAVPCVYASELSFFTTNPRQMYLQTALQELRRSVARDLKTFCRACEDKLDNILLAKVSTAISPRTPDPVLSSATLGSSFSVQNETPSSVSSLPAANVQRKLLMDPQLKTPSPAVEKRLAKLEMYGEPPAISPILISQSRRSLRSVFKAPRRTDSPSVDCKQVDKSSSDQI